MSNIYIQEPPTNGKVLLHTTVGDIDIELWSKEAPKACRNFVQLCMENYYDGTIFHRVIKGFIAQGGDPNGDGTGGESIYGKPFKDEFHSRLRFVRRGLVAMANAGKDDNGSQFFFTLGSCPDLQSKHTVFGKVAGDTLYNMLKLEECIVDKDDRPVYPHKIISSKVLSNPFPDIVPRINLKPTENKDDVKPKEKLKKNFKLLSFGDFAEEEEMETETAAQVFRGKSKSSHDLTNDPKLSSVSVSELYSNEDLDSAKKKQLEGIRKKLKMTVPKDDEVRKNKSSIHEKESTSTAVDSPPNKRTSEREAVQKQIKELTKELRKKQQSKQVPKVPSDVVESKNIVEKTGNPLLDYYHKQLEEYSEKKKKIPQKKEEREKMTLMLMNSFKDKVRDAIEKKETDEGKCTSDEDDDEGWLTHKFHFDEREVLAKDANMPSEDKYDITDPRNPINQRRREDKKRKNKDRPQHI